MTSELIDPLQEEFRRAASTPEEWNAATEQTLERMRELGRSYAERVNDRTLQLLTGQEEMLTPDYNIGFAPAPQHTGVTHFMQPGHAEREMRRDGSLIEFDQDTFYWEANGVLETAESLRSRAVALDRLNSIRTAWSSVRSNWEQYRPLRRSSLPPLQYITPPPNPQSPTPTTPPNDYDF